MEGVKESYINGFMAIAVVFCVILFFYGFSLANNVPSNNAITNSPIVKSLNSSISKLVDSSSSSELNKQFSELGNSSSSSATISFGWIIYYGVIGFGKTLIKIPMAIVTGLSDSFGMAFGYPIGIIINIFVLCLIAYLIVLLVRFWRSGS